MNRTEGMILGLMMLRGRIVRASFYNSSGDTAHFTVHPPLSDEQQRALVSYGWEMGQVWESDDFSKVGAVQNVGYCDGGDWGELTRAELTG